MGLILSETSGVGEREKKRDDNHKILKKSNELVIKHYRQTQPT